MYADAKIINEIKTFNPHLVGFSGSTSSRHNFFFWGKIIKNLCPNSIIIVGGPHVTFEPISTLEGCKYLDGCVVGEGHKVINSCTPHIRPV